MAVGQQASQHPHTLSAEVRDWRDWPKLASTWTNLVDRCPHATFFLSTPWVETWLESFGTQLQPKVLIFRDRAHTAVGACLLVRGAERKGPFTIRTISLNTSGEPDEDSPCSEFNTLLCEPGYEGAVAMALRGVLEELRACEPWDQFVAGAVVEGRALVALRQALLRFEVSESALPSHYVDLDELRGTGKDFPDTLGTRERTHYRYSIRRFSKLGELQSQSARTATDALAMLDELAALHQKAWNERGIRGSFASRVFFDFHRALIRRCFPIDQVQLLRLRAGESTLGAVYNFVYRGKLYFYQCGYNYSHGKQARPGMVVQAFAIRHATALGLREYDFMAGDADYKRKLATRSHTMHSLVWQASGPKMKGFQLLRNAKRELDTVLASRPMLRKLASTVSSARSRK